MIFIKVCIFVYKEVVDMLILNLQTLREGTKYASYRVTLPKDIIEAKGWEKTKFILELKGESIILRPSKG